VSDTIDYLSAIEEGEFAIARADARLDAKNMLTDELVSCRIQSEFTLMPRANINYMDVSPKQIVSWPPRSFLSSSTTTPTAR